MEGIKAPTTEQPKENNNRQERPLGGYWEVKQVSSNEILAINKDNPELALSDQENLFLLIQSESEAEGRNESKERNNPGSEKIAAEASSPSPALEKLLKQSLQASCLLDFKGGSLDGNSARNLLVAVIAKEILRVRKNKPLRAEIYSRWANAIKALFPGENTTTYYVPCCTRTNGKVLRARGKLVFKIFNEKRRLQRLGILTKKNRCMSSESSSNQTSKRPPPSLLKRIEENETLHEDLNWLHNSSAPWLIVLVKWKNTVKERMRMLHEENEEMAQSIESYFEDYPALKKPFGYILLISDFDEAYGQYKDNLFINYPLVHKALLNILIKRKKKKDTVCAEILELSQSGDEKSMNLAGFLSITHLLTFSATATFGQRKKRVKTDKTDYWKPSKSAAGDSFVSHVKADVEINQTIQTRYESLQKRGISPRPFIIIVGEKLGEIKRYIVVANENVHYERSNIMQAVDTCYKIFWSLNSLYCSESYPIWYFIQRGLYKMTSKWDKGSTSVESLLTDCNL